MALTPLTAAQEAAADSLVRAGRLDRVPADHARCASFLAQAAAALGDLPNVRHPQNVYNLAYDAAHDVGEAMLASYGFRTRHGAGQHDALGRYLAAVFDVPPANAASQHFEQMRRDRNRQRYDARPTTTAAAAAAAAAAAELYRAAIART